MYLCIYLCIYASNNYGTVISYQKVYCSYAYVLLCLGVCVCVCVCDIK